MTCGAQRCSSPKYEGSTVSASGWLVHGPYGPGAEAWAKETSAALSGDSPRGALFPTMLNRCHRPCARMSVWSLR